jgi:hypothetical protein
MATLACGTSQLLHHSEPSRLWRIYWAGVDSYGSAASAFSLGYIFFRAAQHRIPGSAFVSKALTGSKTAEWSIPVWLGEFYAVFKKVR